MAASDEKLYVREWLFVALAIGSLCGLVALTVYRGGGALPPSLETISVSITGAVAAPGVYTLPKVGRQQLVGDILALAHPLEEADLSKMPRLCGDSEKGWSLRVPAASYVEVSLSGAVAEAGIFRLPKGARLSDLLHYTTPMPEADLRFFKRRRLLRDGEEIIIPFKSSPKH